MKELLPDLAETFDRFMGKSAEQWFEFNWGRHKPMMNRRRFVQTLASTAAGFNNNRWRGVRRWPHGSEWWLQSHHLIRMLAAERAPLKAGTPYATTAGV